MGGARAAAERANARADAAESALAASQARSAAELEAVKDEAKRRADDMRADLAAADAALAAEKKKIESLRQQMKATEARGDSRASAAQEKAEAEVLKWQTAVAARATLATPRRVVKVSMPSSLSPSTSGRSFVTAMVAPNIVLNRTRNATAINLSSRGRDEFAEEECG